MSEQDRSRQEPPRGRRSEKALWAGLGCLAGLLLTVVVVGSAVVYGSFTAGNDWDFGTDDFDSSVPPSFMYTNPCDEVVVYRRDSYVRTSPDGSEVRIEAAGIPVVPGVTVSEPGYLSAYPEVAHVVIAVDRVGWTTEVPDAPRPVEVVLPAELCPESS